MRKTLKMIFSFCTLIICLTFLFILINYIMVSSTKGQVFNATDISLLSNSDAVVINKRTENETSTLDFAIAILKQKKADKVFLYGDTKFVKYAEEKLDNAGVKKDLIITDTGELSDYEMGYSLKNIYEVNSAIFIDEDYTVNRQVFIGKKFGISCLGLRSAENEDGDALMEGIISVKDFFQVNFKKYFLVKL